MEIKRDRYLKKIISFMWDGQVKVITGICRCGKSYLLRNLFKSYLLGKGVAEDHILSFELDLTRDIRYRNPLELAAHVREIVEHSADRYYLFIDEIQMSDEVPNPYNPCGRLKPGKNIFFICIFVSMEKPEISHRIGLLSQISFKRLIHGGATRNPPSAPLRRRKRTETGTGRKRPDGKSANREKGRVAI